MRRLWVVLVLDSVELSWVTGIVMGKNPRVRLAEDIWAVGREVVGKLLIGPVGVEGEELGDMVSGI